MSERVLRPRYQTVIIRTKKKKQLWKIKEENNRKVRRTNEGRALTGRTIYIHVYH